MGKVDTPQAMGGKEMEKALESMDEEQRDHLRIAISELVRCYTDDTRHGIIILTADGETTCKLIAVNTTDMDAADMLHAADQHIHYRVLSDAPPKEQFN